MYKYDHLDAAAVTAQYKRFLKAVESPMNFNVIACNSKCIMDGTKYNQSLALPMAIVMAKAAAQGGSTVKYRNNLMDRPAQHERAAKELIYKLDHFNDALVKPIVTLEYPKEREPNGVPMQLQPLAHYNDIIRYADTFAKIAGVNLHFMKQGMVSSNYLARGSLVSFYDTYRQEDKPHGYIWVIPTNFRYEGSRVTYHVISNLDKFMSDTYGHFTFCETCWKTDYNKHYCNVKTVHEQYEDYQFVGRIEPDVLQFCENITLNQRQKEKLKRHCEKVCSMDTYVPDSGLLSLLDAASAKLNARFRHCGNQDEVDKPLTMEDLVAYVDIPVEIRERTERLGLEWDAKQKEIELMELTTCMDKPNGSTKARQQHIAGCPRCREIVAGYNYNPKAVVKFSKVFEGGLPWRTMKICDVNDLIPIDNENPLCVKNFI